MQTTLESLTEKLFLRLVCSRKHTLWFLYALDGLWCTSLILSVRSNEFNFLISLVLTILISQPTPSLSCSICMMVVEEKLKPTLDQFYVLCFIGILDNWWSINNWNSTNLLPIPCIFRLSNKYNSLHFSISSSFIAVTCHIQTVVVECYINIVVWVLSSLHDFGQLYNDYCYSVHWSFN